MQHYRTLPLIGLLALVMSGCGFHLRGSIDMPAGIEPFYLSASNQHDTLLLELKNIFTINGLTLTNSPAEANYQLIISQQTSDRRSTSIGNDGRIAEYQLIETVTYVIKDKKGAIASGPNQLTDRQILTNDPNRVISTESEQQLLRDEMKKSLARKVARQASQFNYRSYEAKQTTKTINKPSHAPQ
jgi:LPS-assembly lipoprotein